MLRLKGLSGFCLVIVTIGGLLCVTLPQTAAAQSEPVTAAVEQDTTKRTREDMRAISLA